MADSPSKRTNDGNLTRQKILESAVKHFGAHGYRGASLRNIIADAGVNLGAANYHFGSKKKVYFAAVSLNFNKTYDARIQLMEAAILLPKGKERLRALVHAYIAPHIELVVGKGEHAYGRLITQLLNDDELIADQLFASEFNKVRILFRTHLNECCPHADDDQLSRGIGFVVACMSHAPFDPSYRTLTDTSPLDQNVEAVIDAAVTFAFGGLCGLLEMEKL